MDFHVADETKVMVNMINEFVDKELIPLEPDFLSKPFSEIVPILEEKRRIVSQRTGTLTMCHH